MSVAHDPREFNLTIRILLKHLAALDRAYREACDRADEMAETGAVGLDSKVQLPTSDPTGERATHEGREALTGGLSMAFEAVRQMNVAARNALWGRDAETGEPTGLALLIRERAAAADELVPGSRVWTEAAVARETGHGAARRRREQAERYERGMREGTG